MRPFSLDPLFKPLESAHGIGPRLKTLYERLVGGSLIKHLLFHTPSSISERLPCTSIAAAPYEQDIILALTVEKHTPPPRRPQPYRIRCSDLTGFIDLVFFNAHHAWLHKQYPEGQKIIITGRIEDFKGTRQITHPEILQSTTDTKDILYPLTAGLTNKMLRKIMLDALSACPVLPEWHSNSVLKTQKWDVWDKSLRRLHYPESNDDLLPESPFVSRLAYDELLANQLTLAIVRRNEVKNKGRAFPPALTLRTKILSALPWALTNSQKNVLTDIDNDMTSGSRMLRLIQGDVGSGKTIVALIAMLNAVNAGAQAAIMAPTEILARQHEQSFRKLLDGTDIKIVTLTGRDKGKARQEILSFIETGKAHIIIGTHSLFQESIKFHDLGIAVIDEQHRFGVHQRLQLSSKTKGCDVLVMTATPIPRTLALTAYGDLDVSRITEKPIGRKAIDTRLIPLEKLDELIARLQSQKAQIYWVCPLVEESELLDLSAAEERFEYLKTHFGDDVGLVHGRMKAAEKDSIMQKFVSGAIKILVATTVIEVGVNVPNATIMVIEHAERFGLAQLHQLRGRVGRGSDQSYCFLAYSQGIGQTAKKRLTTMRDTNDGFIIAEEDLKLRGFGEILGTKQSGIEEFHFADLIAHADLLSIAKDDALHIINKDPELISERGKALRVLLYLFERDRAIAYLRSG